MSDGLVIVFKQLLHFNCGHCCLVGGRVLVQRVRVLNTFNIPEPVVGGILIAALLVLALHQFNGFSIKVEKGLQDGFM